MIQAPALEATSIVEALRRLRFRWATEDELQRGLASALAAAGFTVEREVRLNQRDRIDLLVGTVGIEVKVAGAWREVERQLHRYLESDRVQELILVTVKASHCRIRCGQRHSHAFLGEFGDLPPIAPRTSLSY